MFLLDFAEGYVVTCEHSYFEFLLELLRLAVSLSRDANLTPRLYFRGAVSAGTLFRVSGFFIVEGAIGVCVCMCFGYLFPVGRKGGQEES